MNTYAILDIAFMIVHPAIILFNLFGWIWKRTRSANLILLTLTGLSWFVLGLFMGIGYCPFTDWHWQVLAHLGKTDLPYSYIKYLIERLIGISVSDNLANGLTIACYFIALGASIYVNFRKKAGIAKK